MLKTLMAYPEKVSSALPKSSLSVYLPSSASQSFLDSPKDKLLTFAQHLESQTQL